MQLNGINSPTTIGQQQNDKENGVGKDAMDQQDFLNLLITQLQNQDPLSPLDNADFMAQTTAFSQLDEMINMNKGMQSMVEMMQMMAINSNSLLSGANTIGKEIEYMTNMVTIGKDAQPNISFYLGEDASIDKSRIKVYNEAGDLVAVVQPTSLKKGENNIMWDGKGAGGVQVPDGTYAFEVEAYDAQGKEVAVEEFGTGVVQGIKMINGKLYFDIGTGVVSSEYVYSIRDPKKEEEEDKPEGGDKPDNTLPDGEKPEADKKAPSWMV